MLHPSPNNNNQQHTQHTMPQDTQPTLHTRIEPNLLKRLKKQARKERRTMRSLVEIALERYMVAIDRGEAN